MNDLVWKSEWGDTFLMYQLEIFNWLSSNPWFEVFFTEICNLSNKTFSSEEIREIKEAYEWCEDEFRHVKKRRDWSTAFAHIQRVTLMTSKLSEVTADWIIVSLLHDIIEDTRNFDKKWRKPITYSMIEKRFWSEIAKRVLDLTKADHLDYFWKIDLSWLSEDEAEIVQKWNSLSSDLSNEEKIKYLKLHYWIVISEELIKKLKNQRNEEYYSKLASGDVLDLITKCCDRLDYFNNIWTEKSKNLIKKINETRNFFLPRALYKCPHMYVLLIKKMNEIIDSRWLGLTKLKIPRWIYSENQIEKWALNKFISSIKRVQESFSWRAMQIV